MKNSVCSMKNRIAYNLQTLSLIKKNWSHHNKIPVAFLAGSVVCKGVAVLNAALTLKVAQTLLSGGDEITKPGHAAVFTLGTAVSYGIAKFLDSLTSQSVR